MCAFGLPWIFRRAFGWADVYDVPAAQLTVKRDCDWLCGAYMFIRREALEQAGGFDERFFFYGEDIELCYRFARHGWRRHYDPEAAIVHLGGASSDPTRLAGAQKNKYIWLARYEVQRICYGPVAAWMLRAADAVAGALRALKIMVVGKREAKA